MRRLGLRAPILAKFVCERKSVAVIAAGLAAQSIEAFLSDNRNHSQRGNGVGPPLPKDRVQEKSPEQNGGQVSADVGLAGVRVERAAADIGRHPALRPG